MTNRNRFEIIIGFLVFWSFCFLNGFFNPSLSKNLTLFYIVEIVFWIIFPFFHLLYLTKITNIYTFTDLGFRIEIFQKRNIFILLSFSIVFALIIQYIYFSTYSALSNLFKTNYFANFDYETTLPNSFWHAFILTIYYSVSAGVVEEIYYRAVLANLFLVESKLNTFYILMSSFLFSINHWEGGIINLLDTFLYGIIFAVIYNKTRNIWPLIIAHTITDIIAFFPKESYK